MVRQVSFIFFCRGLNSSSFRLVTKFGHRWKAMVFFKVI